MKRILSFVWIAIFIACTAITQAQTIQGTSAIKKVKAGRPPVNTSGRMNAPPDLVIVDEVFSDMGGNNTIDGGETAYINFKIQNLGAGDARNVVVNVSLKSGDIKGLTFTRRLEVGTIVPSQKKDVTVNIMGGMDLADAIAEFKIEVLEDKGFDAYPLEMKIETSPFQPPVVVVADAVFSTESGGKLKLNTNISLKVLVQNIGRGDAKQVGATFNFPKPECFALGNIPDGEKVQIGTMKPGDKKQLDFLFVANRRFQGNEIPVGIKISESVGRFGRDTVVKVKVDQELLAQNSVTVTAMQTPEIKVTKASLTSEVDKNIPETSQKNNNRFALIIGNEEYSKYQSTSNTEVNVAYARNDATVMRDYVVKTLGFPESNVLFLQDATTGAIKQKLDLITKLATTTGPDAEIFFYYAGHGLPDEVTHIPYLIPVDVSGANITSAIKLSEIYTMLSETKAKRITVILDACFTGGGRAAGLLAARSVKVKPSDETLNGNLFVFSATSEEQSALPYEQEKHGIFTFYVLKKLKETSGNVTYKELSDYVIKNVSIESLKVNEKPQTPAVNTSADVINSWQNWKFR